jgi:hypothetical protein
MADSQYDHAMSSTSCKAHLETIDERTVAIRLLRQAHVMTWNQVLESWRGDGAAGDALGEALAGLPFAAFHWETPALNLEGLDRPFECVAVNAPSIDQPPDRAPFDEHLRGADEVVCFPNLGGDALMIVPAHQDDDSAYAHLARFLRHAPTAQQRALWRAVGRELPECLRDGTVWLNTAGGGVAWLHVRLDRRPKYYLHAVYRKPPASSTGAP